MTLREFVLYLGQNPYQVLAAHQDPHAVMAEAGLSPADQVVLTSGDPQRILAAIVQGVATELPTG